MCSTELSALSFVVGNGVKHTVLCGGKLKPSIKWGLGVDVFFSFHKVRNGRGEKKGEEKVKL